MALRAVLWGGPNEDLNLGEVLPGIALEDHPRTLVIDLAGRQHDFEAAVAGVAQDHGVGSPHLLIRPEVQERERAAAFELAHRDAVARLPPAHREAGLEVGIL